jgi:hypothetical protein
MNCTKHGVSRHQHYFLTLLKATAREHKGKLALDSLLIMPVQRIPRYELLIKVRVMASVNCHFVE